MDNKKLGTLFIVFSIVFLAFLFYFNINMSQKANELGCFVSSECVKVENFLNATNVGFGFFGFMFGLGFYLLFFNRTEDKILKKLEEDKNKKINDSKFDTILKALDSYERKVMKAVKEHNGITQNILRLRTDMSKAKLSYVLQELEKRNLIKRVKKGKTLEVFLKI